MTDIWRPDSPEAQRELATAMERLEEAIVVMDSDGSIRYATPVLGKILAIPSGEMAGRNFYDVLSPNSTSGIIGEMRSAGLAGRSWRGIVALLKTDGSESEIAVRISPTASASGSVVGGAVAIIRDVSGERHLEERLRHSQKLEAIGTLAGGIAHDFNNILSAVLGFAELASMDAPEGSELKDNIMEVLTAGRRARDLVKQLLTFSRQSESRAQPFVMKPVVNEALKLLRSSLPSTIDFKRNLDTDAAIIGDPSEVHQVLMNLCTNAAMAMKQKGGVLTVELAAAEVSEERAAMVPGLFPGPHVMLLVRDTGCGMIPEIRDRIFDPFFTTRKEGEGQGLGLSAVHGIVTNAGGGIEVESEIGAGTVFRVFWPRIEPEQCEGVIETASLPTGIERVLFVDDEDYQVALARKMLGALGYKVTALTSPFDALKLFSVNPKAFDLVVTDITMPGMTGLDFASALLRIRPGLPIILCTGYSELVTGREPSAFGARALVAKPVVMREMAETMRRVLDAEGGVA